MQKLTLKLITGFMLMLLLPVSIRAESVRSLVDSGNRAYEQSDYGGSLDFYERALKADPESTVVLFNKGSALYKKGEYAEAFDVYEQAAARALAENDPKLEALSRYNMGNSAFRKAEALSRNNPEMSLEEFNRSGQYFESAAKLDPGLTEAGHNLEVARTAAKQVEEMIRQQKEQARQQQQADEQLRRKLEELGKQQNAAAGQSEDLAQQQQELGGDPEIQKQLNELADKQAEITENTKSLSERLEKMAASGQEEKLSVDEHLKTAVEKQKAAQENLQKSKPEQANISQKDAAEELQKALQKLEQTKEETKEQGEKGQTQESSSDNEANMQPESEGDTREHDADTASPDETVPGGETPEDIINQELEDRKNRGSGRTSGYVPVEKDW